MQAGGEEVRWPEHGAEFQGGDIVRYLSHHGECIDTYGIYNIIRCERCRIIHATPIPTDKELALFYQEEFYEKAKPDYIERYEKDRTWWEMTHRHNINAAEEFLASRNGTQPTVLEVGAGPGIFLDVACNLGWNATGIEPSKQCSDLLRKRNHNIFNGTLGEYYSENNLINDVPKLYDYIYLYEVLEHCPLPDLTLSLCWDMLKPGGLIGVEVPNDYNVFQLRAQKEFGIKDRWWVAPPQHLNYFTPTSLTYILEKCEFRILERRSTWPMEAYLFAGYNYIGNDAVGRRCHRNRMLQELAIDAAGLWRRHRAELQQNFLDGIGREIFILARKVDKN